MTRGSTTPKASLVRDSINSTYLQPSTTLADSLSNPQKSHVRRYMIVSAPNNDLPQIWSCRQSIPSPPSRMLCESVLPFLRYRRTLNPAHKRGQLPRIPPKLVISRSSHAGPVAATRPKSQQCPTKTLLPTPASSRRPKHTVRRPATPRSTGRMHPTSTSAPWPTSTRPRHACPRSAASFSPVSIAPSRTGRLLTRLRWACVALR